MVGNLLSWKYGVRTSEVEYFCDKSISSLRAEFSYGMGLVLEQLRIQQRTLDGILDRLDAIHETLILPRLTQARELSRSGMERLQRGLLPEALKDFLESVEKNETDFLVQLQIGKLSLYGRNLTDDVIDLPSAEKRLRLAARYANSEIQHLPDAAKFCGEAFLHAAISCYAQANEKWLTGDADAARHFTEQALELSQNATKVYPQLMEAFYHHAKFAALLGNGQTTQSSLKTAILADRIYCIKADTDRDFDGVRGYVHNLLESLRQQAKQKAIPALESVKRLLEDWVYQTIEAKKVEAEIRKLFGQAESLYCKDTYFDYLDALPLLKKAQQTFDQIPIVEFTPLIGNSDYVESVVLFPEGVISRQEFEEQERLRIETEKEAEQRRNEKEEQRKREMEEAEQRRKEEEKRRKRETEEAERRRREQELREYRLKNKLCLECGEKLSFWDKLSGAQYCKRHRK